jgi:alkylated DNA repair dioxygenase AlkB
VSAEQLGDFDCRDPICLYKNVLTDTILVEAILALSEGWVAQPTMLFGKAGHQNRRTAKYGDKGVAHCYSGDNAPVAPWPLVLLKVLARLGHHGLLPDNCNLVVCNRYDNTDTTNHSIPWHADDEPDLDETKEIATLSIGTSMAFLVRDKVEPKTKRMDMQLPEGSVLLMLPGFQERFQHSVPGRKYYREASGARGTRVLGPRVSLTFRSVIQ